MTPDEQFEEIQREHRALLALTKECASKPHRVRSDRGSLLMFEQWFTKGRYAAKLTRTNLHGSKVRWHVAHWRDYHSRKESELVHESTFDFKNLALLNIGDWLKEADKEITT